MMSKKHYSLLARILAAHMRMERLAGSECAQEQELIRYLHRAFLKDNPRFDPSRFKEACNS